MYFNPGTNADLFTQDIDMLAELLCEAFVMGSRSVYWLEMNFPFQDEKNARIWLEMDRPYNPFKDKEYMSLVNGLSDKKEAVYELAAKRKLSVGEVEGLLADMPVDIPLPAPFVKAERRPIDLNEEEKE